jgi:HNH endonuclease
VIITVCDCFARLGGENLRALAREAARDRLSGAEVVIDSARARLKNLRALSRERLGRLEEAAGAGTGPGRLPLQDPRSRCTGVATEVDHVVLKSQGGRDEPSNLRASCVACNSSRPLDPEPSGRW